MNKFNFDNSSLIIIPLQTEVGGELELELELESEVSLKLEPRIFFNDSTVPKAS